MDSGASTSPLDAYQNPLLRRRNSIPQPVLLPASFNLHQQSSSCASSVASSSSSSSSSSSTSSSSASSGEFDLISVKPVSYTSLRDLLPSTAVNSPRPPVQNQVQSGSEISIRNRLVKQAAWAYLQPMSSSPDSSGRNFLRRMWDKFTSENPLAALSRFCDRYVCGRLNRAFDWLLRVIWVRSSR